jgi:hypothetical protein
MVVVSPPAAHCNDARDNQDESDHANNDSDFLFFAQVIPDMFSARIIRISIATEREDLTIVVVENVVNDAFVGIAARRVKWIAIVLYRALLDGVVVVSLALCGGGGSDANLSSSGCSTTRTGFQRVGTRHGAVARSKRRGKSLCASAVAEGGVPITKETRSTSRN